MTNKYIKLENLEVYKLARELSKIAWGIYDSLDWQTKKIMAEGYGRFHYLDRIKFLYNARGSLIEANEHWVELLKEREKVKAKNYQEYKKIAGQSSLKLQNFISSTYKARETSDTK